PFSGGRTYYSHPSLKRDDQPKIIHQSSATGMQAIPTTGIAMGLQYLESQGLTESNDKEKPLAVCSLGDASVTEGEVAEAFQMAALKQFPILYLVQDNEWDISATAEETRAQNAYEYIQGFHGIKAKSIEGNDFAESYQSIKEALEYIRTEGKPYLLHAKVPLLGHHTSGVRREWYRHDLKEHGLRDPLPLFRQFLLDNGFEKNTLDAENETAVQQVQEDYERATAAEDPKPEDLFNHDFAPTPITEEMGER